MRVPIVLFIIVFSFGLLADIYTAHHFHMKLIDLWLGAKPVVVVK